MCSSDLIERAHAQAEAVRGSLIGLCRVPRENTHGKDQTHGNVLLLGLALSRFGDFIPKSTSTVRRRRSPPRRRSPRRRSSPSPCASAALPSTSATTTCTSAALPSTSAVLLHVPVLAFPVLTVAASSTSLCSPLLHRPRRRARRPPPPPSPPPPPHPLHR